MCQDGQGQIGGNVHLRRKGVWNRSAKADYLPDQHEINVLLSPSVGQHDREVLAKKMLAKEVVTGVFETLKVLHEQFESAAIRGSDTREAPSMIWVVTDVPEGLRQQLG